MPGRSRLARVAVLLWLGACGSSQSLPDLNITLTTADGQNPSSGHSFDTVRVWFREGTTDPFDFVDSAVVNGAFDVTAPIHDYSAIVDLRFELRQNGAVVLLGELPAFYPGESSTARVIVGVPNTCARISSADLTGARADFGATAVGAFAAFAGGTDASGASANAGWFDLVDPFAHDIDPFAMPLGATSMVAVTRLVALVVSEGDVPFLFNIYASSTDSRRVDVSLHAGAGIASALLDTGDRGAVIVGGLSSGAPVREISHLATDGSVTTGRLAASLPERAAAFANGAAWVVSRDQTGGAAMLEQWPLDASDASVLIPSFADGVRNGGILFVSSDGSQALLLGGADGTGQPRSDTVSFSGCPSACVASAGPAWTTARANVAMHASGLLVGGDGANAGVVEEVTFDASGPHITPFASLVIPRKGASVLRFPAGMTLVLGGESSSGLLLSVEACFPASIAP